MVHSQIIRSGAYAWRWTHSPLRSGTYFIAATGHIFRTERGDRSWHDHIMPASTPFHGRWHNGSSGSGRQYQGVWQHVRRIRLIKKRFVHYTWLIAKRGILQWNKRSHAYHGGGSSAFMNRRSPVKCSAVCPGGELTIMSVPTLIANRFKIIKIALARFGESASGCRYDNEKSAVSCLKDNRLHQHL